MGPGPAEALVAPAYEDVPNCPRRQRIGFIIGSRRRGRTIAPIGSEQREEAKTFFGNHGLTHESPLKPEFLPTDVLGSHASYMMNRNRARPQHNTNGMNATRLRGRAAGHTTTHHMSCLRAQGEVGILGIAEHVGASQRCAIRDLRILLETEMP